MADEHCNLKRISWSETFPFVRLFSTFGRAISFGPLVLAFLCVTGSYITGRLLDAIWTAADAGVLVAANEGGGMGRGAPVATRDWLIRDEIEAYARLDAAGFAEWTSAHAQRWSALQERQAEADAEPSDEPIDKTLALIATRVEAGLKRIDEDEDRSGEEKEQDSAELQRAADTLRLLLKGFDASGMATRAEQARAVETVIDADQTIEPTQRAEEAGEMRTLLERCRQQAEFAQASPRGPFMALLDYEMKCFSAAIHGVCNGRWGLSGSAMSSEPAMIGSITSAGSGALWFVTQSPWYALVFILIQIVIFAFFGGAICRIAAVRATRDETLGIGAALAFSRSKLSGLVGAPLLPIVVIAIAGLLIALGGLVAAIPALDMFAGLFYFLSLLGGLVLMFAVVGLVTGFHLMWPTIAVESSEAFDAVQHGVGYVFQRAWNVAFYSFVLLIYGGVCFVIVRIFGMLVLKLSNAATGLGMNVATSSQTDTIGRLDAMWQMPAWQELPLLPALGDVTFWGDFVTAPLGWHESAGMFLMACWVFGVVGLVGAFVVSFYFCGSTEMYLLLRRDVDAVDYDEIYYEEEEDDLFEEEAFEPAIAPSPAGEPPAETPAPEPEEPKKTADSGESAKPEEPSETNKKPRRPARPRKPRKPNSADDKDDSSK